MALPVASGSIGSDSVQDRFETFEKLLKGNFSIVQEMADQGDILEHELIRICQKHGIKFRHSFLKSIGINEGQC